MSHASYDIVLTVGVLLVAALLGGQVAGTLRLPRVTAYLLIGMLFSPYTLKALPVEWTESLIGHDRLEGLTHTLEHHLEGLHPIGRLAMALVLFNMGCHFTLVHVRRIFSRVARLSAGELSCTFACVFLGTLYLVPSWQMALLFGVLAMATAPATTMLVLKECESEGPVTEYTVTLVAMNNLAAVIGFEVAFVLVELSFGSNSQPWPAEVAIAVCKLAGCLAIGALAGLTTSYGCNLLPTNRWLVFLIGMATVVLGLCQTLSLSYLLAFLAMGAVVANSSDRTREIVGELNGLTGLLCVVFFVIHGAEMDLHALFASGAIGMSYIVCRIFGKCIGLYFSADSHADGPHTKKWLGAAMLSQAGAAIALSSMAAERDPERFKLLQDIILGTVVVFEIIGPMLVRQAVYRSGEIPLDRAIRHSTTTAREELNNLWSRVALAFGFDPWKNRQPDTLQVHQVMKSNVKGIYAKASFDEVVQWMEQSHDNTFPVIGSQGELVGVIRYMDVRDVVFDPELGQLVCAEDLAVRPAAVFHPDQALPPALDYFRRGSDDAVPVVSHDDPAVYVGLVRRKDVVRLLRRSGPILPNRSVG